MKASARTRPERAYFAAACLVAVSLVGNASCTAERAESTAAIAPAGTPADELPLKEFMGHVVAYSAQNMWDKQGWITDAHGERSQFPRSDEEWEQAESAALTLGELMSLLVQPGRRIDVPEWDRSALLVRSLARQAAQAAERHDEAAFFALGTQINEACDICHRATGIAL